MMQAKNQYLAWGGESADEGFALLSTHRLRAAIQHEHYTNLHMWTHFALLELHGDNLIHTTEVQVAEKGRSIEYDYLYIHFAVMAGDREVDSFVVHIDQRA